jgi:D-tyrosyl-tRNA(Tyr) deacylase
VICVLQRVSTASVSVAGERVGHIDAGLLGLVAVLPADGEQDVRYLADRILNLRIFADESGRMNRSVTDIGGEVLLVSQFTLAADTRRGRRPSFSAAAAPERALEVFEQLVTKLRASELAVETGRFGSVMQVELVNDGPVTLVVDSADLLGDPPENPDDP